MNIKFVNHACQVIENQDVRIICDPWIEGRVFDRGWDLIAKSAIDYPDFAQFSHIWFSHEHPDHFFPPNIVKIPKEIRANLVVLFQATEDKRVVNFCKKQGFKEVIELHPNTWQPLGGSTRVMCENYTEGDSWLAVQDERATVLNTNDCEINNSRDAKSVLKKIGGRVDVLLAQFSYACWAGNVDQIEFRQAMAKSKLDIFLLQIREFAPKSAIPTASFVWFCHEENFYLNHGVNTPDMVLEAAGKITGTETVLLFPGETFETGKPHDNSKSLKLWLDAYQTVLNAPSDLLEKNTQIAQDELKKEALIFAQNMRRDYGFKTRLLKSAYIWVNDYQKSFQLSVKDGLREANVGREQCDVALSSEPLLFCLKFPYGQDTLGVNGRFQRPANGDYSRFYNLFRFNQLKSRGIEVDYAYLFGVVKRKIFGESEA